MWFKQLQFFQLSDSIRFLPEDFAAKLESLTFEPCSPAMPASIGWVSPVEEDDAPLVHAVNGYMMLCLQTEEKILPATVIRQELKEKIKQVEARDNRKVRQKEKLSLKDEVTLTLLTRAFSKLTRLYAYIDTKNHCLVLATTNKKKTEQFISMFKKSVSEDIQPLELKKPAPIITQWLKNQHYPTSFSIEKSAVLQDIKQQNRIIRCKQQDLFASAIQSLIEDGCEVKQLGLSWQDRVNFVLVDDFSLSSIQYQDEITEQAKELEPETKQQHFNADFFIMTETLSQLLQDLLQVFEEKKTKDISKIRIEENLLEMET